MAQILPRRHLRLVQQVATRPHDTLEQLGHAHLPLIRVLIRSYILRHLLRHVLDDLRRDHHVATVKPSAVVGHLGQFTADSKDHVAFRHPVLEGGEPNGAALAQIRAVPVPEGGVSPGQAPPTRQTVCTAWTTLDGYIARPGRVPRQVPGYHRGTHLSAVVVPLPVRARLRV